MPVPSPLPAVLLASRERTPSQSVPRDGAGVFSIAAAWAALSRNGKLLENRSDAPETAMAFALTTTESQGITRGIIRGIPLNRIDR
jgi:hypothetical protein